jgi:hypothetical protein
MSRSITRPFGSIVLATLATGVGAALAAAQLVHVGLPVVDPQPLSGDISAVGQHAGWNLEASVDANRAQSVYVGWTTVSSQPLLNGDHGASAGTSAVAVDGINVQVGALIGAVRTELGSVLGFERSMVGFALNTTNATTQRALAIVSNIESSALAAVVSVEHAAISTAVGTTNSALILAMGTANKAVALATTGTSVNAGLMGQSQSASTDRLNTGGTGVHTSGMAPSGVGVAISGGAVSAAAGAAGTSAGASISLPRR